MIRRLLLLLSLLLPTTAFALSAKDKADIADRISKAYPAISVTVVDKPIISGDNDPAMFRISPAGKKNYGNLFLSQRYDIIAKPDMPGILGSYACDLADQFVRERRKVRADFLPPFQLKVNASIRDVGFEVSADRETFTDIVYAILLLADQVLPDYDKFDILLRGYADSGQFKSQLKKQFYYDLLSFFPLKSKPDPFLTVYLRTLQSHQLANGSYTNEDLPNLRGTFMKREVIDRFLTECRITRPGANLPESVVLDGGVVDVKDPDYRTIDIFFYAYR